VRTWIPWVVMAGAAGIFASVVLLRRPAAGTESSRAPGERRAPSVVREHPEEKRASDPGESPPERFGGPGRSPVGTEGETPGKASPDGPLATRASVPAARPPREDFWEGLGALLETRSGAEPERYRRELMLRTAEYLELDPARAGVFHRVAQEALTAIQDAWKVRDADVLTLPASIDPEERDQREQEIQERYETAKRQASDRLGSLLGTTARHLQFRQNLGEWIDAVR